MTDEIIKQENYRENPQMDYSKENQWMRNVDMFKKCSKILYPSTKNIYEFIKNYCRDFVVNHPQYPKFVWKPKICDVGCGGGFGSNILSQEADFVWGIDIGTENIKWCKELFERNKNNIYYTPQLTFDVFDPITDPREVMAFDIVACVEVIEHIDEYQKLLDFMKKLCKKDKQGNYCEPLESTKVFISSPNRNNKNIGDDHPKSKRHVREWTPGELYEILTNNFKYVTLMNDRGELKDLNMEDAVMMFKVEVPK